MLYLRQSTASQSVLIGPFVDDADGATAESGLSIANTDIRLSKNGGNLAAKNSGGATHDEAGWYTITLDATDTDTVGRLQLHVKVAGALMVHAQFQVLEEDIYDALIAASAAAFDSNQRVDVGSAAGQAVGLSSDNRLQVDVAEWNDVPLAATNPLPNAAADGAGGLPISDAGGLDLDALDSNVSAILTDTGTTLPGVLGTPSDFGSGTSTLAANLQDMADNGTASFDRSTDSLQAIRDRGDAAWTTGAGGTPPQLLQSTTIATLATQTSFTLTAGSGDDDAYNGAIAVITDQSTATQKAVGLVSDYTGSTRTVTLDSDPGIFTMATGDTIELIAALGSSSGGASAGAIADAVWDEALSGHTGGGSAGERLARVPNAAAGGNGGLPTVDASNFVAGVQGTLNTLDDLDTAQDSQHSTTQSAISGLNDISTAEVNAEVDSALADYDSPTKAELDAGLAGLNDLDAAGVRAALGLASADLDTQLDGLPTASENATAVLTTQMTESYAANGAAPTLAQAQFAVHQMLMQFGIAGTSITVKQLDNSSTAFIVTLDDDTNPTSAERT